LTTVDGGGRTLMPRLIDAHAHVPIYNMPNLMSVTAASNYLGSFRCIAKAAGRGWNRRQHGRDRGRSRR
jgi:predicted amidohydrolase YtcJ